MADLIDLTNRVKLAAVALAEANAKWDAASKADTEARKNAEQASNALRAAEHELLKAARRVA